LRKNLYRMHKAMCIYIKRHASTKIQHGKTIHRRCGTMHGSQNVATPSMAQDMQWKPEFPLQDKKVSKGEESQGQQNPSPAQSASSVGPRSTFNVTIGPDTRTGAGLVLAKCRLSVCSCTILQSFLSGIFVRGLT